MMCRAQDHTKKHYKELMEQVNKTVLTPADKDTIKISINEAYFIFNVGAPSIFINGPNPQSGQLAPSSSGQKRVVEPPRAEEFVRHLCTDNPVISPLM